MLLLTFALRFYIGIVAWHHLRTWTVLMRLSSMCVTKKIVQSEPASPLKWLVPFACVTTL